MSEEATPAAAKGGWKSTIGIVAVTAVVAVGGAWWWTQQTSAHEAPSAPVAHEASRGLLPFEPFVVNLADVSGTRFLRTTIQLVLEPEEAVEELRETPVVLMQMRSAVLEVLAQQSATALVTPEGKAAVKAAILDRAGEILHGKKVADVLFSEFVVQF